MLENMVLKRIFGPNRKEITVEGKNCTIRSNILVI
jgi:hypothetical protein